MSAEVITAPKKGWSAAAQKVFAGRELGVNPLTAGDFFRVQKRHGDAVDQSRAISAAVVTFDGELAGEKQLDALPVKDYLHLQREVAKATGLTDLEDEAEVDPKPS